MALPWSDGGGFLPDTKAELTADIVIIGVVVFLFSFFTGLDAQVQYLATAPGDYLVSGEDEGLEFTSDSIDLMNEVSSRSIGFDPVAAERLYCGEIRNGVVRNFRLADYIKDSDLTSVSGGCESPVDVWVHSQPSGNADFSEEDKDLESSGAEFTCVQYSEISSSLVNQRLGGISCYDISQGFEEVPVFLEG